MFGVYAGPRLIRNNDDILSIERHFLQIWDGFTVFATGILCALAYTAIKFGTVAVFASDNTFFPIAMRISVVAGLLAPLVLQARSIFGRNANWPVALGEIALQVGILVSALLAIGFLTRAMIYVPREWGVPWSVAIFISAVGGRAILPHILHRALPQSLMRERVVIAGERAAADELISHFQNAGNSSVEVIGVFCDKNEGETRRGGFIDDLVEYGKRHPVDRVLLAMGQSRDPHWLVEAVNRLKALNTDVALCPCLIGSSDFQLRLGQLGGVPLVILASRPLDRAGVLLKSMEDKILAGLLLLLISPLMVLIATTIRLDSPGPALFRQRRHGLNNAEFEILKFRTMASTTNDPGDGRRQTQRNDTRVTRVGNFLRRSSLDELPQLFNVLRGEMSLVGPRPHPTAMRTEDRLGAEIVADYPHRHRVKPGMTGWAQINGYRGATQTADQVERRVAHDIFYIENWSLIFDLKILALTPVSMILNNDNTF